MMKLRFVLLLVLMLQACQVQLKSGSAYNWYYFRKLFYSAELDHKKFVKEVPFTYENGLIYLPVRINNSPETYHFIFDTGAEVNIISERLVNELGLETKYDEFAITDANDQRQQASYYKINELSIGGVGLENTGALSTQWSDVLDCIGIDGIIGANTMEYFIWSFDFKNKKVLITDQKKNIPKERLDRKIRMYQSLKGDMFAELEINDEVDINAQFDTGCVCFIILQEEDTKKINDKRLVKRRIQQVTGATSTFADTIALVSVNSIMLEKTELNHDREVDVRPNINRNYLGNEFMFDYYLTLDTDNGFMYLADNHYNWEEKGELRLSNIDFGWSDQKIFVAMYTLGGEIENLGIRYNDRVVRINNTDFTHVEDLCSFIDMREELQLINGHLEVTVLRDGEEMTFKIPKSAL